jgi:hypothetical protein
MNGKTREKTFIVFASLILLASGCSSGKTKPTDKNFMAGLNDYYASHNECLFPSALRFPYEVSPGPNAKKEKQQMDALMNSGLMKVNEDKSIHVDVYALTPAGERAGARFCYGHRQVTGIESFTPPVKENGMLKSQVTYRYRIVEVPVWAKTEEMEKAFPDMAKTISSESTGQTAMANAGAGWQVPG